MDAVDRALPALTEAELKAAKAYLRVEDDEEDPVVSGCVLAAREYMAQAGIALPEPGNPRRTLYDLVCYAITLSTYDQREPVMVGAAVAENPVLRRMLIQLKLTEPAEGGI